MGIFEKALKKCEIVAWNSGKDYVKMYFSYYLFPHSPAFTLETKGDFFLDFSF